MDRYNKTNLLSTTQGKPYYRSVIYPNIPLSKNDIYVITTIGDRLDLLAYTYYKDTALWWVISMANNNITKGSLFPVPGTQLRIPLDLNNVLTLFNTYNKTK